MGYILILLVIVVLATCSIPLTAARFPNGNVYEVIEVEYGKQGRRCALQNLKTHSVILCEWNEFKNLGLGEKVVSMDGKLEELV